MSAVDTRLLDEVVEATAALNASFAGISAADIQRIKVETGELLQRAIERQTDSKVGANRWVEHHHLTFQRWTQLCELLDDPSVPDGSFIQLSNIPVISPIGQAKLRREADMGSIELNIFKELLLDKEDEDE